MAACSTLFPLTACVQGLLPLQERRPRSRSSSSCTGNLSCWIRRSKQFLSTRGSATGSIQAISNFGLSAGWMRFGAVRAEATGVTVGRSKRRQRRRWRACRRREASWRRLKAEAWSATGKSGNLPGCVLDARLQRSSSCCQANTCSTVSRPHANHWHHHHRTSSSDHVVSNPAPQHCHHHWQHNVGGVMANLLLVLLLLTTFFLHRCTGVIVHGGYECRSTRPSGQPDAALGGDAATAGGDGRRGPSRIPTHPSRRPAPPHIYSQGDFTNERYNTFQSPRATTWPNHYFPDMECWYNFTAPHGHHVYVEFPLVRIEGDSRMCHWDRDLLTIPTKHMGDRLICGSPTDYGATITGLQTVNIHFKTNSAIEAAGFSGYFFAYPAQSGGPAGRRRRRKRETTNQLMQRLRRWISNPFVREMLRKELLRHQEDDHEVEDIISEEEQEIIEQLRTITLNGRASVREHGCHDCRIAHLFEPCECAGIQCTLHPEAKAFR